MREPSDHSRHLLSCLSTTLERDAREPPRLVPLAPADTRPPDGARARRAARGIGAHGAARRAGTRTRAFRSSPFVARPAGTGSSYRTKLTGLVGAEAEASSAPLLELGLGRELAAARSSCWRRCLRKGRSEPAARPSRYSTSIHAGGFARRIASRIFRDRRRALARPAPGHALPRGRGGRLATARPPRPRAKAGVCCSPAAAGGASIACRGSSPHASGTNRACRAADFDLAASWASHSEEFERSRPYIEVTVRVPRSRPVTCAGRGWWRRASGRPWSACTAPPRVLLAHADGLGRVRGAPELRDRIDDRRRDGRTLRARLSGHREPRKTGLMSTTEGAVDRAARPAAGLPMTVRGR